MKSKKRWFVTALTACLTLSLGICVEALEYDFDGVEDTEYYPSTSYESLYGAKYNYGGSNATDYPHPIRAIVLKRSNCRVQNRARGSLRGRGLHPAYSIVHIKILPSEGAMF